MPVAGPPRQLRPEKAVAEIPAGTAVLDTAPFPGVRRCSRFAPTAGSPGNAYRRGPTPRPGYAATATSKPRSALSVPASTPSSRPIDPALPASTSSTGVAVRPPLCGNPQCETQHYLQIDQSYLRIMLRLTEGVADRLSSGGPSGGNAGAATPSRR